MSLTAYQNLHLLCLKDHGYCDVFSLNKNLRKLQIDYMNLKFGKVIKTKSSDFGRNLKRRSDLKQRKNDIKRYEITASSQYNHILVY